MGADRTLEVLFLWCAISNYIFGLNAFFSEEHSGPTCRSTESRINIFTWKTGDRYAPFFSICTEAKKKNMAAFPNQKMKPVAVSTGFEILYMKLCKSSFFLHAWEIEPAAPKPTQPVQPPKTKETWKMKNFWLPNREARNGYQKWSRRRFPSISSCERFASHFGSQKTTTKIGAAKLPTFPNSFTVWTSFCPQASNGTCSHSHDTCFFQNYSTFASSLQELALAPWRPHRAAPETKDFLTTKTRVANHTVFSSTASKTMRQPQSFQQWHWWSRGQDV